MTTAAQIIQQRGEVKRSVTVDLGDCDEAFRGARFEVWVTPTRAHWSAFADYSVWLNEEPKRQQKQRDAIEDAAERAEFDRVMGEQMNREMYERLDAWLSETWLNQSREETTAIREHLQETFPSAWMWLYNHTLRAIREYRESLSKN